MNFLRTAKNVRFVNKAPTFTFRGYHYSVYTQFHTEETLKKLIEDNQDQLYIIYQIQFNEENDKWQIRMVNTAFDGIKHFKPEDFVTIHEDSNELKLTIETSGYCDSQYKEYYNQEVLKYIGKKLGLDIDVIHLN